MFGAFTVKFPDIHFAPITFSFRFQIQRIMSEQPHNYPQWGKHQKIKQENDYLCVYASQQKPELFPAAKKS
jgi:hypothetical protein